MKNLADVKRRLLPGTVLLTVENTYRPELNGTRRTVTRTQAAGFWWQLETGSAEQRTRFPAARHVTIDDADTFTLSLTGQPGHHLRLRFVGQPPSAGPVLGQASAAAARDVAGTVPRPQPEVAHEPDAQTTLPFRSALAAAGHDGRHGGDCQDCLLFLVGDVVGDAVDDLRADERPYCGRCGCCHEDLLDCQVPLAAQLAAIHRHGWEAALTALRATGVE